MTFKLVAARLAIPAFLTMALTACGGGGSASAIGGTINGLASGLSITLQNNGTDNFTIAGNGSNSFTYAFAGVLSAGATYNVTVLTQPLGQTCTVTNASGAVDSNADNVNSVIVNCSTTSSVVGTVTGLVPGVALGLSTNSIPVTLTANGPFAFPGVLPAGTIYNVTVTTAPRGQTCTIGNPTGTVVANQFSTVTVTCS